MTELEKAAEAYGLQVNKHRQERMPQTYITGEPRPWLEKPDSVATSAFCAGARFILEHAAVIGARDALRHYFPAATSNTVAGEALAALDKLLAEK